ncbi:MAG: S53 family peptidase [Candidatus Eremiobacteraeota bacterium]|nr:S53 family peptidase [Candidatus Eremiobacteraeota bacterium]
MTIVCAIAIASCSNRGPSPVVPAAGLSLAQRVSAHRPCASPVAAGWFECDALVRDDALPRNGYRCGGTDAYCAKDLQQAYGVVAQAKSSGYGATVAIVDAFGYPTAENDLATYRSAMNLPTCTMQDECFRVVNERGGAGALPGVNYVDDWRFEEALDVDMVSAICPNCRIVLVQATTNRLSDIETAEDTAVALGATVVSNSYGGPEISPANAHFNHPGHAIVASAGDGGAGLEQPCSWASVLCVGGTTLARDPSARGWNETAWGGTGSGCSAMVPKPAWQTGNCPGRAEADVSAEASPLTPVAVYLTGGWVPMGGTSASSPIIAALIALAGNAGSIVAPQWVWQHGGTAAFNDVVHGSNPGRFHCSRALYYICNAGPGYDGPTGWGTPSGLAGL